MNERVSASQVGIQPTLFAIEASVYPQDEILNECVSTSQRIRRIVEITDQFDDTFLAQIASEAYNTVDRADVLVGMARGLFNKEAYDEERTTKFLDIMVKTYEYDGKVNLGEAVRNSVFPHLERIRDQLFEQRWGIKARKALLHVWAKQTIEDRLRSDTKDFFHEAARRIATGRVLAQEIEEVTNTFTMNEGKEHGYYINLSAAGQTVAEVLGLMGYLAVSKEYGFDPAIADYYRGMVRTTWLGLPDDNPSGVFMTVEQAFVQAGRREDAPQINELIGPADSGSFVKDGVQYSVPHVGGHILFALGKTIEEKRQGMLENGIPVDPLITLAEQFRLQHPDDERARAIFYGDGAQLIGLQGLAIAGALELPVVFNLVNNGQAIYTKSNDVFPYGFSDIGDAMGVATVEVGITDFDAMYLLGELSAQMAAHDMPVVVVINVLRDDVHSGAHVHEQIHQSIIGIQQKLDACTNNEVLEVIEQLKSGINDLSLIRNLQVYRTRLGLLLSSFDEIPDDLQSIIQSAIDEIPDTYDEFKARLVNSGYASQEDFEIWESDAETYINACKTTNLSKRPVPSTSAWNVSTPELWRTPPEYLNGIKYELTPTQAVEQALRVYLEDQGSEKLLVLGADVDFGGKVTRNSVTGLWEIVRPGAYHNEFGEDLIPDFLGSFLPTGIHEDVIAQLGFGIGGTRTNRKDLIESTVAFFNAHYLDYATIGNAFRVLGIRRTTTSDEYTSRVIMFATYGPTPGVGSGHTDTRDLRAYSMATDESYVVTLSDAGDVFHYLLHFLYGTKNPVFFLVDRMARNTSSKFTVNLEDNKPGLGSIVHDGDVLQVIATGPMRRMISSWIADNGMEDDIGLFDPLTLNPPCWEDEDSRIFRFLDNGRRGSPVLVFDIDPLWNGYMTTVMAAALGTDPNLEKLIRGKGRDIVTVGGERRSAEPADLTQQQVLQPDIGEWLETYISL